MTLRKSLLFLQPQLLLCKGVLPHSIVVSGKEDSFITHLFWPNSHWLIHKNPCTYVTPPLWVNHYPCVLVAICSTGIHAHFTDEKTGGTKRSHVAWSRWHSLD